MKKLIRLLLIFSLCNAHGQNSLEEFLSSNRMLLEPDGEAMKGNGWDFILGNARESKYVMIGEDHGTAEIPHFVTALSRQITFSALAIEVDPWTASALQASTKLNLVC